MFTKRRKQQEKTETKSIQKLMIGLLVVIILLSIKTTNSYASETEKIQISQEEQKIVDNIMNRYKKGLSEYYLEITDFEQIEEDLIYLKSIYPECTYQELWDKMYAVGSEEELEELFEPDFLQEENSQIGTLSVNEAMVMTTSAATAVQTTQEYYLDEELFEDKTLPFDVIKLNRKTGSKSKKTFKQVLTSYNKAIPGLIKTRTKEGECTTMVPQGICVAGSYILISAYDAEEIDSSVVYVVDKKTLTLQTTLALDITAHAGGIAYDSANGNLWVCYSKEAGGKPNKYMYAYKIDVDGMVRKGSYSYIKHNRIESVDIVPSCCTIYNGRLWIATFSKVSDARATMMSYDISGKYGYTLTKGMTIDSLPYLVQGIDFKKVNGVDWLAMSTSFGRKNDSDMYVYRLDNINLNGSGTTASLSGKLAKSIELPSMSEGVVSNGNKMYMIYESGCWKYRNGDKDGNSTNPCDRITVLKSSYVY